MKKYPKYKDSGVEWLGEIPSEWLFQKLNFLTDHISIATHLKEEEDEEEDETPSMKLTSTLSTQDYCHRA